MPDIDVTDFVTDSEPSEFSGSIAERGANAGPETWANANTQAASKPMLNTRAELNAMRQWARETGAWDREEIAAWSDTELNALFIQLVSGDMREAGLNDPDDFDWDDYREQSEQGQVSGNLYRSDDGRIYFYLGS